MTVIGTTDRQDAYKGDLASRRVGPHPSGVRCRPMETAFTRLVGIEHPIVQAPIGTLSNPRLAAAVSNAGGLGVLGMLALPAPAVRDQIRRVRALTTRPFGVNLVIARLQGGEVEVCLEERVPLLVFFWGDPGPYVDAAHRHGTRIVAQVGSVAEARAAAAAGVDAIIAQGVEAGGHVRGTTSLLTLLPSIVGAVAPVPVIAAGGIADGRGLLAALDLGAQAVSMGTRFLASEEAAAARAYKDRIVAATAEDTVYTHLFDIGWPDAPHRVLRNRAVTEWEQAGRPAPGRRPGEGAAIGRIGGMNVEVLRYSVVPPLTGFEGDLEYAALYAGESCSVIDAVKPAAAIVRDVVREAERLRASPDDAD